MQAVRPHRRRIGGDARLLESHRKRHGRTLSWRRWKLVGVMSSYTKKIARRQSQVGVGGRSQREWV